jgi:hypothetical protein
LKGNKSREKQIREPIHRILHKFISNNFTHRSQNQERVYTEDVFYLRLWIRGAPHKFALAPYQLAKFLANNKDGELVCGHFITQIYANLNLTNDRELRSCTPPTAMKEIGYRELKLSGIVTIDNLLMPARVDDVVGEEEEAEEAEDVHEEEGGSEDDAGAEDLSRRMREFELFQRRTEEGQHYLGSHMAYQSYHTHRFQPLWEDMAQQRFPGQLPTYAPPSVYQVSNPTYEHYYPPAPWYSAGSSSSQQAPVPHQFQATTSQEAPPFFSAGQTFEGGSTPSIFPDP